MIGYDRYINKVNDKDSIYQNLKLVSSIII